MKTIKAPKLILLLSASVLAACGGEPSTTLQDSINTTSPTTQDTISPTARFDPSNSILPFPSNLLFSGTTDGTLNIPVADAADFSNPQVALNALDGFSTVAPMTTTFTGPIDASSINGNSVRVYEVGLSAPGGAAVSVTRQLTFGVDYIATVSSVDMSQSTLAIVPLRPLAEKTSYMVAVSGALRAVGGAAFSPSTTYLLLKTLANPLVFGDPTLPGALQSLNATQLAQFEALRQLVRVSENTVSGSNNNDIIVSWRFTTQSVGDVLEIVRGLAGTPATAVTASTVTLGPFGPGRSPLGAANVFEGTISVPYYLTAPSTANPTAILNSPWQAVNTVGGENNLTAINPLPAASNSALTIPMLITTPFDTVTNPPPWRTVIFQHGITTNRTVMLAVADALAAAGLAVVAIDLPLHGVDSSSPFFQAVNERTFGVDFVTEAGGSVTAQTPDGTADSSGRHFINLSNLLVSRDNFRQGAADLFALTAAIPSIDVDGGGPDLNGNNIYFFGHSLGAMVATPYVAIEPNVRDAVFTFGGGGIAKILDGSNSFSPSIVAGLAAVGVVKGTPAYESFLGAAQTVVDTVDPLNHAIAAATNRGILFQEIVGGNSSPSDLTVPNTVPDGNDTSGTVAAPLAGTEPLLTLMGLTQVNSDQAGSNLKHSVKFVVGNHSTLLTDAADAVNSQATNAAVRAELQTLAATFLASDGASVNVTDASLLQAP